MKKVLFVFAAMLQFIAASAQSSGGHEYVDLGLSVKWATCNVGANSITDLGSLFRWGETDYAPLDSWDGYKYAVVKNGEAKKITKYRNKGIGADKKSKLELSDDAASVNWGSGWRMPTKDEATELLDNCEFSRVILWGAYCIKATSKLNGNCIYFPDPAFRPGHASAEEYNQLCYWTSALELRGDRRDSDYGAYYFLVDAGSEWVSTKSRSYRCQVRPVRK